MNNYRITFDSGVDDSGKGLNPIEVEALDRQDAIGEGISYILNNNPWCMIKDVEEVKK